jgi:hypothetical protein
MAAETASRQRFFLAMAKNGPYSEFAFARGEKFFVAYTATRTRVAGEVR